MKRFFLTAVVAAIGLGAYPASGQAVDSTRSWGEGPLRWEEFRGDGSFQEMNALSVISWQEQTQKERVGYIRYYYPVIHAVFRSELHYESLANSRREESRKPIEKQKVGVTLRSL